MRRLVDEAALRFGLPVHWIRAVLAVESAGDRWARSPQGAMGLMQIMPDTWTELRSRYGLGADPFEPRDNILAGAAYLREMHDRFGSPGFLAAYNAGPERYEDHLRTGRALASGDGALRRGCCGGTRPRADRQHVDGRPTNAIVACFCSVRWAGNEPSDDHEASIVRISESRCGRRGSCRTDRVADASCRFVPA